MDPGAELKLNLRPDGCRLGKLFPYVILSGF